MRSTASAPPAPFLSLQDATFRLGDRLAFKDTDWCFGRGEHWGIVGPNGSGKSLLADALRGRLPLVRGELRYHFRPPEGLTPEDSIGHVSFEDRRAEVHETVVQSRWNSIEEEQSLRVRDFLSYERVMEINPYEVTRGHAPARARFERRQHRAVALLGIGPFLERRLLTLSNGERQRLHLARALSHPMRLLILDEPFFGLDVAARKHFHAVLEHLMSTALRVLLITTRTEDLPRQVTHLLRVEGCRVVAAGRRSDLLGAEGRGRVAREAGGGSIAKVPAKRSVQAGRSRSADGEVLLRLQDITVSYGASVILRGLNWTVQAGESWALLGPNGSGKTTALSLILGDNPQAYRNDVEVFGQRRGDGESIWDLKRRIGWVSPELHLHFNHAATCFEVVASGFHDTIGLVNTLSPWQRQAARHWLRRFGLLKHIQSPLFSLSAGWQRLVLLARALAKKPCLLILDEPCQGLDPAHRSLLVKAVDGLIRAKAVTVIYVTHRADEIPPSIKRVLRLAKPRSE